jgi:uncharacterized protein YdbL (DUF1318 family)
MKNMFSPCSIFAGIVAILLASGCATTPPGPPSALPKIAQQKDLAQQWARKVKSNPNVDAATLNTAEAKYRVAASQNKGYLVTVGNAIRNNQNLESNPAFQDLAKKSEDSTNDFVEFAKKATGAPTAAPRSVFAAVGAGAAAKILVESGIAVWKAHREQTLAERQAAANQLVSENTWEDWDQIR